MCLLQKMKKPAGGQFGGIRDAAPDAWDRRVIEAYRKVPANALPESVYLLEAGSERVGALDVRRSRDDGPSRSVGSVHSLQYLLEAVERIERGEPVPGRLTDLLGSGPGAGGARPKASVRDDQGLLWLAKFPGMSDTFDNAHAEWATLELARRCGLTVPAIRVEMLGNRPCLLIRRFDRHWVSQGNTLEVGAVPFETLPGDDRVEHRLPFVSALTLVGCDEMESRNKGYVDIAAAVRRYVAPAVIRDNNRELFARMVFNILVSNDDDHLRNHGFLRDPRLAGWRLSPLYDVVPRPGIATERFLHLQVGKQGKLATLDNALSRYAEFNLNLTVAKATMARMVHQVSQWKSVFEELKIPGPLIDVLAPAFRKLDEIAGAALKRALLKRQE